MTSSVLCPSLTYFIHFFAQRCPVHLLPSTCAPVAPVVPLCLLEPTRPSQRSHLADPQVKELLPALRHHLHIHYLTQNLVVQLTNTQLQIMRVNLDLLPMMGESINSKLTSVTQLELVNPLNLFRYLLPQLPKQLQVLEYLVIPLVPYMLTQLPNQLQVPLAVALHSVLSPTSPIMKMASEQPQTRAGMRLVLARRPCGLPTCQRRATWGS